MTTKQQIGNSGLYVNPIGMGTNAVGGHNVHGEVDEQSGKDLVKAAVELGIDHFDTAFIYGPERSEILVGEAIAELGVRRDVIIATKGAYRFTDDGVVFDNTPEFLRECVEGSLKRLQTDYIDLFYIHWPDENTPKYEAVGALQRMREEGKVKAIGVSNFSLEQLEEANKDGHVDAIQSEYSLLQRSAENDVLPYCKANQISFIPYFPMASGLLSGKYTHDTPLTGFRKEHPMFLGDCFEENLNKVDRLKQVAQDIGAEPAHIALAWCLTRDAITSIIPGAKNEPQLRSNLKAAEVQLDAGTQAKLDEIFRI